MKNMDVDVLFRDNFVNRMLYITEKLSEKKENCCFAIDGEWGVGKSFVLEMYEAELKDVQSEETADNKYFVFHYNCWKYDYYNEPVVAIISSMIDYVNEELSLISKAADEKIKETWIFAKNKLKEIAGKLVESKIGINFFDLHDQYIEASEQLEKEKWEFDQLFLFRKTLEECKGVLREISDRKTIVIVVDELDRCLPEYSIKVLERLHHLFEDVDNVIMILSVDGRQLSHSIKSIYGQETKTEQYLKKFIDFRMNLDKGKEISIDVLENYRDYFNIFILEQDCEWIEWNGEQLERDDFLYQFYTMLWQDIGMRDQEKLINKARIIHNILSMSERYPLEILLFEMLVVRYQEDRPNINLRWLAEIMEKEFVDYKKKLGETKYNEIKDLIESGISGKRIEGTDKGIVLHDNTIGKLIYLLGELFTESNERYLEEGYEVELVKFAGNFIALAETIM